jgi:hypothetical protein
MSEEQAVFDPTSVEVVVEAFRDGYLRLELVTCANESVLVILDGIPVRTVETRSQLYAVLDQLLDEELSFGIGLEPEETKTRTVNEKEV